MKIPDTGWHRKIWALDIEDLSWTEDTVRQVDFIIHMLNLGETGKVLDLACGYGRHSLELARRGYEVTGVDITVEYVKLAKDRASKEELPVTFICDDIRDVHFTNEFDVVINVADGAIGYLEDDEENLKVFDRISDALKPGGKHFMDVCNAEFAADRFPMRNWEIGEQSVSLPEFDWDLENRRMLYGGWNLKFGDIALPPEIIEAHSSIRLYAIGELGQILSERGMTISDTSAAFTDRMASEADLQIQIYSTKNAI
jgi:SAM-dependent methyltransferase